MSNRNKYSVDQMIEEIKEEKKQQMLLVKAEADAAIKALLWVKNKHNILYPKKPLPTERPAKS